MYFHKIIYTHALGHNVELVLQCQIIAREGPEIFHKNWKQFNTIFPLCEG